MKECRIIRLDGLAWLRVSGTDARDFLQGQLSSDLRKVDSDHGQISSFNSPKGRMLAILQLWAEGDELVLELPRSLCEAIQRRLRMFVLRAKVRIDDPGAGYGAIGLAGSDAHGILAELGLPAPVGPLGCTYDPGSGLTVLRRLGAIPRYSVHGAAAALTELGARLPEAEPFDAWRRADIESGVPVVLPQTSDHFIPQTANLDRLGGISFDKGCYTGQEIVARLHYLGQVKRRLAVVRVDGPAPEPGSDLLTGASPTVAGEFVDAVADGSGGAIATAVVQLSHAGDSQLHSAAGAHVVIVDIPGSDAGPGSGSGKESENGNGAT